MSDRRVECPLGVRFAGARTRVAFIGGGGKRSVMFSKQPQLLKLALGRTSLVMTRVQPSRTILSMQMQRRTFHTLAHATNRPGSLRDGSCHSTLEDGSDAMATTLHQSQQLALLLSSLTKSQTELLVRSSASLGRLLRF